MGRDGPRRTDEAIPEAPWVRDSPEVKTGRVTVSTWLDQYLSKRTNRTADNDRSLVENHVLSVDWFAAKPLQDVRPRDCLRLVEAMRTAGKLGEKSISTVYGIVRRAFARAAFEELIGEDPSKLPRGTLRRKTARANQRQPYTRAEAHALIYDERIPMDTRVWNALAFFTGMRQGEICGRRWRDWHRDTGPLTLLHVHTQYDDRPLKTDDGDDTRPRMVPIHPELQEMLSAWWSEGFELVHCRPPTADDWIVPTRDGGHHTKSSGYKMFQRALLAVGVQNRSLHSTRHTFISVARSNGARRDVLERVTHNASGEVIDIYTTFEWRALCEAVARFDLDLDPEANRAIFSAP